MSNPISSTLTRRNLLGTGTLAATAVAVAGLPAIARAAPPMAAPKPDALTSGDIGILNFALSLENLEASYYTQVLGAHNQNAYLSDRSLALAQELATIEASHVQTLQQVITGGGGTPVAATGYIFPTNVFVSPIGFAWFGYTLEEIGVGAYLGALGHIEDDDIRASAASIYGAETRHAALLRTLSGFNFAPRYFESPLTVSEVQGLIAKYIQG